VAGLALEGLQGIKVVKGPRATGAAADVTAATGNAAADATAAATRNAPTPGAAPAPTSTPRTNAPVREVGSDPLANTAAVGDKTQAFPDPPPTDPVGARGRNLTTAELASDKAAEIADDIQVYETNLAYARSVGVSDERIAQLTAGAKRGDTDVANALYREGLIAEGKQIDMPLDEYGQAKFFQTRSQLGTLTEADYQWLRNKLAADPNYLDNLPNRGRLTHPSPTPDSPTPGPIDDFDASITTAQRDALLNDPRVAQMVDEAKAAGNAGTAQLPVGTTDPTRQLGPGASAPTVRVDPADTTPTVKLDPADATPTVRLDPADATPTVRLDRADATPTVRLDPADATPTVRLDPNKTSLIPPPSPATRVDPNKTVTMDPRAAAQATDELMQSLPKARQSGQSPQQAAALVRNAMTRFGVGPQQIVTALRQRLFSARPVSFADLGNAETAAARGDIAVSLQALGVSSGVAFNVNAVNSGKMPIQLQGEGIVIEPINGGSPISRTATTQVITEPVEAFCLERVRPVAPQGTQYRVAPPAMQTQHRRLVDILHAANRVMDASGLHPDSDPKTYFNFIRQWSIWSRQENFDEKRFSEEFMNQTKKNVESQGVKWTNQMQDTVRKAAPGRWRDILGVLTEATKLAPRG